MATHTTHNENGLCAASAARQAARAGQLARLMLALCLIAATVPLAACTTTSYRPPATPAYVSPYDFSNLVFEEGRCYYYQDGAIASRVGIDVSEHQGSIDWNAVADDGIEFAMVRLGMRGYTEGLLYVDEQFEKNIREASAAGLDVGVYFFSQAVSEEEALEEADFLLAQLGGRELAYPVAFDHEPINDPSARANNVSREELTRSALAFLGRVEAAGYEAMLYGNARDAQRFDLAALGDYAFWFAEYDARFPSGQFDFVMWQYSNNGSVAGISRRVDMNVHFIV
ncbi:MAG: glycoside hydrolase family 25 protein [Coriobacteriales bacterium]|jgi:GH25 family lysozyme M1 (1,4-beta-N-acetylmuramidase)|nr:glycoside hydrolase family 25 protein [Coriobacteriales bacterium]